jgi:hypothetical protein
VYGNFCVYLGFHRNPTRTLGPSETIRFPISAAYQTRWTSVFGSGVPVACTWLAKPLREPKRIAKLTMLAALVETPFGSRETTGFNFG